MDMYILCVSNVDINAMCSYTVFSGHMYYIPVCVNVSLFSQVLKLPTEFLTSLQLDEDLRKSVTTVSVV